MSDPEEPISTLLTPEMQECIDEMVMRGAVMQSAIKNATQMDFLLYGHHEKLEDRRERILAQARADVDRWLEFEKKRSVIE